MRAALYARFSSDQQRDASIEDQLRQCERTALAQGFSIVCRFEDKGISGGTTERPGYQSLLAVARAGVIDVIVAEDISRLWRNRSEFGARSAELEDLGIHLVTCVGEDTRRDGWGLVMSIKAAIAEHARKEISYRTRRSLEGLALSGKPTGAPVPFGYRTPEEASILAIMFKMRAEGATLPAIASWLNESGHKAPRGGRWNKSSVLYVLRNPRYAGTVIWGRTTHKGGAADSRRRRVIRRAKPLSTRKDAALQLIDPELFAKVQGEG